MSRNTANCLVARLTLRKLRDRMVSQIMEPEAIKASFTGQMPPSRAPARHRFRRVGFGITLRVGKDIPIFCKVVAKESLRAGSQFQYRRHRVGVQRNYSFSCFGLAATDGQSALHKINVAPAEPLN